MNNKKAAIIVALGFTGVLSSIALISYASPANRHTEQGTTPVVQKEKLDCSAVYQGAYNLVMLRYSDKSIVEVLKMYPDSRDQIMEVYGAPTMQSDWGKEKQAKQYAEDKFMICETL